MAIPDYTGILSDREIGTFLKHLNRLGQDECWLWGGHVSKDGYGRTKALGVSKSAHRIAYKIFKGPVPDGLTLDHLCGNPRCCNPGHLEAVPHRVNVLRSLTSPSAVNARKTHCKNGHEFTSGNTSVFNGMRRCRACLRAKAEQARRRKGKRVRVFTTDRSRWQS
jgi:hypothetical protein